MPARVVVAADSQKISVIIPALNESVHIGATLSRLQPMRQRGHEIIVVDGGSDDITVTLSESSADRVINSLRGRAWQMNAGARVATGDIFWFLHADTLAPEDADLMIVSATADKRHVWGRFNVDISASGFQFAIVAWLMNQRSRLSGIATGDQGIFMTRTAYAAMGGFEEVPLMEDIAASRILKKSTRPATVRAALQTSGRRWQCRGVMRTIVTMWALRLAYFLGVPPARLVRYYPDHPR